MPSKSKAQSRLMHAAESMKKGEQKPKGTAGKIAKSMSKKELKKFKKTKQKGLPEKKKKKSSENCEKSKRVDESYLKDPLEAVWLKMNESLENDNSFYGEDEEQSEELISSGVQKEDSDEVDVVEIEVPLLIRVMEYVREDVSSDDEIHEIAEKIIEQSKSGVLTMDCVDNILQKQSPTDYIDEGPEKIEDEDSDEDSEEDSDDISQYVPKSDLN